jgi:hypothetical protein
MTVKGKDYEFKRPTLRVERNARALVLEFVAAQELEFKEPTEENFAKVVGLWDQFVTNIFVDGNGLDYGELTREEAESVIDGFFAFARPIPKQKDGLKT